MPVHNAQRYLDEAVQSILTQSFAEFEFVIIDDGSSDGGPSQLDSWAAKDKRVRVFTRPHRGIVAALNFGWQQACGDLIARMDADDRAHVDRLTRQVEYLSAHPEVDVLASRVGVLGDAGEGLRHYVAWSNEICTSDAIERHRFVESPIVHPSVMMRRDAFESWGGYRQVHFPEDYELWLRWAERGVRFAKLEAKLIDWRDRSDRLTRADTRYDTDAFYRCKTPYLARWLLKRGHMRVIVWGAGRTARKRAEQLVANGVEISDYVDIDPKKIGQSYAGRPVLTPQQVPSPGSGFVLAYVASRGAGRQISGFLEEKGYRMGYHFLLAA